MPNPASACGSAMLAAAFATVAAVADAQAAGVDSLAPSCASVVARFTVDKSLLEPGNLLVVEGKRLVEADGHAYVPRIAPYAFYYLFRNDSCGPGTCVSRAILLIKSIKLTNANAPDSVFLQRESSPKTPVDKNDYDDFHSRFRHPFKPYNWFHLSYDGAGGAQLHTHFPPARRQNYLFVGLPAASSKPWLTARNYAFQINSQNQLQCIPIEMQLQKHTTQASIEVVLVEDGTGGDPTGTTKFELIP